MNIDYKNKKIAVVGAGVEGVSTVGYLQKKGAEVHLFDKKPDSQIDPQVLNSLSSSGARTYFGPHHQDKISEFEIIFRSPGVRPDLPQLLEAKKQGSEITSQTKLFFDVCQATIIGITGTKGKGTTASLLFGILKTDRQKVFLGGNIGNPPLSFLDQVTGDSVAILELSSFQLIDLHKSPQVAVVLMVTSEHLDWHENHEEYVRAKEKLVLYQGEQDTCVVNADFPTSRIIGSTSKGQKYFFSLEDRQEASAYLEGSDIVISTKESFKLANVKEVKLLGEHNLQNILAASLIAHLLGVAKESIAGSIKDFRGLEHRLEFVREVNGVSFYNDSASTIPETTIAALRSFDRPKILIAGGSSKNSDFTELGKVISKNNVKILYLVGEEKEKIRSSIESTKTYRGEIVEDIDDNTNKIVQDISARAEKGDVVLLSPACASFGMFKNYKDRGDQFKKSVFNLK